MSLMDNWSARCTSYIHNKGVASLHMHTNIYLRNTRAMKGEVYHDYLRQTTTT